MFKTWGHNFKLTLDIIELMIKSKKVFCVSRVILELILDIMGKFQKFREPWGHNLKFALDIQKVLSAFKGSFYLILSEGAIDVFISSGYD